MKKLFVACLALSTLVGSVEISKATDKQIEDLAMLAATLHQVALNDGQISEGYSKAKIALDKIDRELAASPNPQRRKELEDDRRAVLEEVAKLKQNAAENEKVLKGVTEQQKQLFGNTCPKSQAGRDLLRKSAEAAQNNVNNNNNLNQAGAAVPAQPAVRQSWYEWLMGKNKQCSKQ